MKSSIISEEFKTDLKKNVLDVLNGNLDVFEVDSLHPGIVIDYLKELGIKFDLEEDMETNGWQWDYWIYFKYNEKRYVVSGSGYYGDLKVRECTDEENEDEEEKKLIREANDLKLNELCVGAVDLIKEVDDILKNSLKK